MNTAAGRNDVNRDINLDNISRAKFNSGGPRFAAALFPNRSTEVPWRGLKQTRTRKEASPKSEEDLTRDSRAKINRQERSTWDHDRRTAVRRGARGGTRGRRGQKKACGHARLIGFSFRRTAGRIRRRIS